MKNCVYIGIGGFLGAISRYLGENFNMKVQEGGLPINTLLINISGCFILAMFLTLTLEAVKMEAGLKLAISTGFLGSYTTFSTFCKEVVLLISGKQYPSAVLYILLSVLLGLVSALLGYISAKMIISGIKKSNTKEAVNMHAVDGEANKK